MFYFLFSFSGNLKLACHGVLHPGGRLSSGAYDSETDFAFTQRCTISAQNTVVLEETCHSLPHLSASKIPGISPRELPMAPCFPHGSCLLAIDLSPANHTPPWPRSCSGSLRCSRSVTAWFSLHLTSLGSPLLYGVAVLHRYQDPEFPRMWLSASALVSAGASSRARKSFQRNRSRRCRELATIPASVLHTLLLLFILPFAPG